MAHIIYDRCRKLNELAKTDDLGNGKQEADGIDFQVTNAVLHEEILSAQKNFGYRCSPQLAETGKEVTFCRNFLRRYHDERFDPFILITETKLQKNN